MRHRKTLVLISAFIPACFGSGTELSGTPGYPIQIGSSALRAIEGCEDLEQTLRDRMAQRMGEELADNLESALAQLRYHQECFCGYAQGEELTDVDCGRYYGEEDYAGDPNVGGPVPGGASTPTAEGASEYSTTNTQVAGVDEADFVKNDGSHVYMVAADQLLILDAWPAPATHVIASVAIEGVPTALYVEADHAVVYSDVGVGQSCSWDGYGYVALGAQLKVTTFDITDRAAPRLDREVYLSGSYVNSRRIGSAVHTVVSFPHMEQVQLPTWPADLHLWDCSLELTEADVVAAFEALRLANQAIIDGVDMGDFMPSAVSVDHRADGSQVESGGLFVDCENFYEPPEAGAPGYLSLVSFNLAEDQTLGAATILGRAGEVYASHENLYVAVKERLPYEARDYNGQGEITRLHKFNIDALGRAPTYRASGGVPGRLINQFAMDEHEGALRVATTEGYLPSPDCTNNVFVLSEVTCLPHADGSAGSGAPECADEEEQTTILGSLGAIRGIAPTEDIRSVRFDGDRGFMVTFKKTDPLFAFDLSNPRAPYITGELKIPGYSTYMHFMDEDHLLTIGFDAEEAGGGSFAWFQGVMLQVFDVSDMSQPTLAHKTIIGTRGTTSDATNDHMAFNYFPNKDLLAIPMGICEESSGGGSYGNVMTFNGLLVFRVTAAEGFSLVGGVDHREPGGDYNQYNCYNWWENPNSQVKRSIFMDDYVFSISPERLKVNELGALDADLASIGLPVGQDLRSSCY